jgi:hypothetical protein
MNRDLIIIVIIDGTLHIHIPRVSVPAGYPRPARNFLLRKKYRKNKTACQAGFVMNGAVLKVRSPGKFSGAGP